MNFIKDLSNSLYGLFNNNTSPTVTLTKDELDCSQKIAEHILKLSKHTSHPTLVPSQKEIERRALPRSYAIIFRQSESWIELKNNLKKLQEEGSQDIKLSNNEKHLLGSWIKEIETIELLTKMRLNAMSQGNTTGKNRLSLMLEQKRISLTEIIQKQYIECTIDIKSHNNQFIDLVKKLAYNWQKLWIFLEWPEVALDSSKLYARVGTPQQGIDLSKYLNFANKAVVEVKEFDILKKTWTYKEGKDPITTTLPSKIDVKKQDFGPASPFKARIGSQVQLKGLILDGGVIQEDKDVDKITSSAERIKLIVENTIFVVNKHLAEKIERSLKTYI